MIRINSPNLWSCTILFQRRNDTAVWPLGSMSDIFISYATKDRPRAEQLARALEARGWSVFWDRTIPVSQTWPETIGQELDNAGCVVVLWSKASIESAWVREEADDAKRRHILVPALIENVRIPIGFRSIQAADVVDWDGTEATPEFLKLVVAISSLAGTKIKPEKQVRVEDAGARESKQNAIEGGQHLWRQLGPLPGILLIVLSIAGVAFSLWLIALTFYLIFWEKELDAGDAFILGSVEFVLLSFCSWLLWRLLKTKKYKYPLYS